ncbi:unnamed protein product [Thlaspi arvense]|uniref:Uncharacterized protein n=1 Tax=Thlaspi arvense TaxID=13288 RepID=A0AAU9REK6_THLAR|nr:unnamed protein product [Thlaspi arvense]
MAQKLLNKMFSFNPKFDCSSHRWLAGAGKLIIIASIPSVTWPIGGLIMGINIFYLLSSFIKMLGHGKLVAIVFLGLLGFSGIAIYLAAIGYLVLRKNREPSSKFLPSSNSQPTETLPREDIVNMQLPNGVAVAGNLD